MYRMDALKGARMRAAVLAPPPLGPGFEAKLLERADLLEVWGTRFDDPGADYCEFRLFDAEGREIGTKTIPGY